MVSQEFIDYVCEEVSGLGNVRYKRMFGACVVYVEEKPVILIDNDVAYIKKHPDIDSWMQEEESGFPYEGSKEHYILNFYKHSLVLKSVAKLVGVLPYPKKKSNKGAKRLKIN